MDEFKDIDQYAVPREKGMLEQISIDESFYDITTETIAKRVFDNKSAFEAKFAKKNKSSQEYYNSSKQFVQEV